MTTVTDPLADVRVRSQVSQRQALGQEDFLKLMVTQLRNQDPFKPMENGEFLGQIAQFSTVSGIQGLQEMFGTLSASLQSDQALQAAGLVGRTAMVNAGHVRLASGAAVGGAVELPAAAADVVLEIADATGTVVRTLPLGTQPAGFAAFTWDGRDPAGAALPDGTYRITARGRIGGRTESLNTLVAARIDSVTLGGSRGLLLNLANLGPVAFASVRQFQ
jgi:flagellar basal-body rod modification protein FlgD